MSENSVSAGDGGVSPPLPGVAKNLMKTHAMPDAIWIRNCFVMMAMKRILHLKPRCKLQRYPSPTKLASLSDASLANRLSKLAPHLGKTLAHEIVQALSEQTVVMYLEPMPRQSYCHAWRISLPSYASNAKKSPSKLKICCMRTFPIRS
jgi:hypothetical protein